MIGETRTLGKGAPWQTSMGNWIGERTLAFDVTYEDWMDEETYSRSLLAEIAEDGSFEGEATPVRAAVVHLVA